MSDKGFPRLREAPSAEKRASTNSGRHTANRVKNCVHVRADPSPRQSCTRLRMEVRAERVWWRFGRTRARPSLSESCTNAAPSFPRTPNTLLVPSGAEKAGLKKEAAKSSPLFRASDSADPPPGSAPSHAPSPAHRMLPALVLAQSGNQACRGRGASSDAPQRVAREERGAPPPKKEASRKALTSATGSTRPLEAAHCGSSERESKSDRRARCCWSSLSGYAPSRKPLIGEHSSPPHSAAASHGFRNESAPAPLSETERNGVCGLFGHASAATKTVVSARTCEWYCRRHPCPAASVASEQVAGASTLARRTARNAPSSSDGIQGWNAASP
mmetsp:Transcript_1690/g.3820  ORF Transcript_1690/g.3820 Transcript_1690/m.3820 type:complete len:330 (+) Transcript_1690:1442-2431(+)